MRSAAILLLVSSGLWAQRNVTSPAGFGRILYPGGGSPASVGVGFNRNVYPLAPPTNAAQGISFVAGPTAPPNGGRGQNVVVAPYPVFVNGNFGLSSNWNWGYGQPVVQQVPQEPQAQQPPVVIVNQYFGSDQTPARSAAQALPVERVEPKVTATNPDRDIIFLIAMKDHSIYAANAYWVEDGTLNYVTIQGDQNSVSMDLVDRELSQRLNRDRKVAFGLPSR